MYLRLPDVRRDKNGLGLVKRFFVLSPVNTPYPTVSSYPQSFTMVAFSSILTIGTLIACTLATPLHFSELDRRALPIGISVSTARTYLSQCECLYMLFLITISQRCILHSDGRDPIQLPPVQQGLLRTLDPQ